MSVKRHVTMTKGEIFFSPEMRVHVNRVTESFELTEHAHDFVEISYVSEGSGFHYIGETTFPVAKGDLFFIPVGVSHVFRPASAHPAHKHLIVNNLIFDESYARRLADLFPLGGTLARMLSAAYPAEPWFHVKDRNGMFQTAFNRLYEEFTQKSELYSPMLQAEIVRLLVLLQRFRQSGSPAGTSSADGEKFAIALELVNTHFHEPLQIRELSEMAGLSERQFRRRFQQRTGMGFTDYIHKLRIEKSCSLLADSSVKVSEIAHRIGYQDLKFFNKLFKKKTGMTPREYRFT